MNTESLVHEARQADQALTRAHQHLEHAKQRAAEAAAGLAAITEIRNLSRALHLTRAAGAAYDTACAQHTAAFHASADAWARVGDAYETNAEREDTKAEVSA